MSRFQTYEDALIFADARGIKRGVINGPIKQSHYACEDGWLPGQPIGSGASEVEAIINLLKILEA